MSQPQHTPTPGYQPMPTARGGRLPLNRQPPSPTTTSPGEPAAIDHYRPPRNRGPLIVSIIIMALVAALMIAGNQLMNRRTAESSSSSSPAPALPAASGSAIPVQARDGKTQSYWEIQDSRWTSDGLELSMRLTGIKGTLTFEFFALDNASTQSFDPEPAPQGDFIGQGTVQAGETVTGTLLFAKDRGDTTVVLADSTGRQITALEVDG